MCLAQGHKAKTPVGLEPAALRSRVKHSTTAPLRSLIRLYLDGRFTQVLLYGFIVWMKNSVDPDQLAF